jgi:phospholipase C
MRRPAVSHTRSKFLALAAAVAGVAVIGVTESSATSSLPQPITPIKHVVVIFDENVSFDHYFGTYPDALNPAGESTFHAKPGTPTVNGLNTSLLDANPNEYDPERLDPTQALTCDQNHGYSAEQAAFDGGLMDKFVQDTQGGGCTQSTEPDAGNYGPNGVVMDYYDGNTVTGLWNLAQNFSLNDNSYSTTFGPSTPGAINLIAGQTAGAVAHGGNSSNIAGGGITPAASGTLFGDAEPYYDMCSNASTAFNTADTTYSPNGAPGGVTASFTGKNIGDLMNSAGVTWGWFQGGFTPSSYSLQSNNSERAVCATAHTNVGGASVADYSEHHEPFQYYATTANPDHNAPSSVSQVGFSDPAGTSLQNAVNHQYDLSWFYSALAANDLPQVSFLKAPEYEDGHAGYSDPLDEQKWLADSIDAVEKSPDWSSTAIVIAYDDSDGWYDHQMGSIITPSEDTSDDLDGPGKCGSAVATPSPNDRCGVGPRQPLLVISPWAKQNYVDSTFTDQSSILQFIENNWDLGRVGGGSADAQAGTLDNMFDFDPHRQLAPAIILNDDTGEIQSEVPTNGSDDATPSIVASNTSQTAASGSTGATGSTTSSPVVPPTLTCHGSEHKGVFVLKCTSSSQTDADVALRARLYRGKLLLGNHATSLKSGGAKFTFKLGGHGGHGSYTFRLSVDAGGNVTEYTKRLTVK